MTWWGVYGRPLNALALARMMQEWGGVAIPSDKICLPYVCSVVDVTDHDYYGGSHPHTEVYSGQSLDSSLIGTDYELYLSASLTSCAVGACV
jgi:hypothetical protein